VSHLSKKESNCLGTPIVAESSGGRRKKIFETSNRRNGDFCHSTSLFRTIKRFPDYRCSIQSRKLVQREQLVIFAHFLSLQRETADFQLAVWLAGCVSRVSQPLSRLLTGNPGPIQTIFVNSLYFKCFKQIFIKFIDEFYWIFLFMQQVCLRVVRRAVDATPRRRQ
jgi:hypothetical protein